MTAGDDKRGGMAQVEIHNTGTQKVLDQATADAFQIKELQRLVKMGEAVVEDFMPNIGQCALQDYGRLNTFLNEASDVPDPDA